MVLPVIHVIDKHQVEQNVRIALEEGCLGVFLINHDFPYAELLPIISYTRKTFPSLWLGVNFLGVTGKDAFPVLGMLKTEKITVNAYWADDARIDENRPAHDQTEARKILDIKIKSGWEGLYFGGTAFKKQRPVAEEDFYKAAQLACQYMDVVTTSGIATGKAPDLSKIRMFRKACKDQPLALASGVTPENVVQYSNFVDVFMVATGINFDGDFYNIDRSNLRNLIRTLNSTRRKAHVKK